MQYVSMYVYMHVLIPVPWVGLKIREGAGGGGASKNTRSFEGEGFDSILTIIVGEG